MAVLRSADHGIHIRWYLCWLCDWDRSTYPVSIVTTSTYTVDLSDSVVNSDRSGDHHATHGGWQSRQGGSYIHRHCSGAVTLSTAAGQKVNMSASPVPYFLLRHRGVDFRWPDWLIMWRSFPEGSDPVLMQYRCPITGLFVIVPKRLTKGNILLSQTYQDKT